MRLSDLQARFGIPGIVSFQQQANGLVFVDIRTELARARVHLQGAHLVDWTPRAQRPVFFLSAKTAFELRRAIRGGVPICFPWFGPHPTDPAAPAHGPARLHDWSLAQVERLTDGSLALDFDFPSAAFAAARLPAGLRVQYRVAIGTTLSLMLEVANESPEVFTFEEALHPYFALGDIGQISVSGTEGATYADKTDGMRWKRQSTEALGISRETDRVYLDTVSTCCIDDRQWQRRIVVEKAGSATTVIWNPWRERAAAIADLGPEQWRSFVCIEPANAMDNAITLQPGERHRLQTRIRVEPGNA